MEGSLVPFLPLFLIWEEEQHEQFTDNGRGEMVGVQHDNSKQHLVLNGVPLRTDDVYVTRSVAVQGEWGLFASRDIKRGESFLQCLGRPVSESGQRRWSDRHRSGYLLQFSPETLECQQGTDKCVGLDMYPYVSATPLQRLAGFINHVDRTPNSEPYEEAVFVQRDDFDQQHETLEMHVRALCDIGKGEEIVWDYGSEFWDSVDRVKQSSSVTNVDKYGKKHHSDDEEEEDGEKKKKGVLDKLKPRVSRKTVRQVKKGAKTGAKVAKVVGPVLLL
jgi:hypothetical protein